MMSAALNSALAIPDTLALEAAIQIAQPAGSELAHLRA